MIRLQPLLWTVLGVTLGPYFFWRGFLLLQHKRLIMDTPRSTIRRRIGSRGNNRQGGRSLHASCSVEP